MRCEAGPEGLTELRAQKPRFGRTPTRLAGGSGAGTGPGVSDAPPPPSGHIGTGRCRCWPRGYWTPGVQHECDCHSQGPWDLAAPASSSLLQTRLKRGRPRPRRVGGFISAEPAGRGPVSGRMPCVCTRGHLVRHRSCVPGHAPPRRHLPATLRCGRSSWPSAGSRACQASTHRKPGRPTPSQHKGSAHALR